MDFGEFQGDFELLPLLTEQVFSEVSASPTMASEPDEDAGGRKRKASSPAPSSPNSKAARTQPLASPSAGPPMDYQHHQQQHCMQSTMSEQDEATGKVRLLQNDQPSSAPPIALHLTRIAPS